MQITPVSTWRIADPSKLICILDLKPYAGFYRPQSQSTPETQYLAPYLSNQPPGGFIIIVIDITFKSKTPLAKLERRD